MPELAIKTVLFPRLPMKEGAKSSVDFFVMEKSQRNFLPCFDHIKRTNLMFSFTLFVLHEAANVYNFSPAKQTHPLIGNISALLEYVRELSAKKTCQKMELS